MSHGGLGQEREADPGRNLCPVCFEVLEDVVEVGDLHHKTAEEPQ